MFRNNLVRNAAGAFGGQSMDDGHPSQAMKRIAIVNNLWLAMDRSFFTMAVLRVPLEDLLIDHNTAIPTRLFSYDLDPTASPALVRFQFTNNLTGFGRYGVKFPRSDRDVARWIPKGFIAANALVALGEVPPESNLPPKQDSELGRSYMIFSGAEDAGLAPDGTLYPSSPLKRGGTDAKDVGVDFGMLTRHLALPGLGPRTVRLRPRRAIDTDGYL
jgi:hypothetical protein